jgi:hypothetical protein
MTPKEKTHSSALKGFLFLAVASLLAIPFLIPPLPAGASVSIAACEYSSNNNSFAMAEVTGSPGAYYVYHDMALKTYVNSNNFWKWYDSLGANDYGQFTSTVLDHEASYWIGTYSTSINSWTNDGTQSGYGGPGYVFVQIANGVPYPKCPWTTPIKA